MYGRAPQRNRDYYFSVWRAPSMWIHNTFWTVVLLIALGILITESVWLWQALHTAANLQRPS
jgi:hypothetical protein